MRMTLCPRECFHCFPRPAGGAATAAAVQGSASMTELLSRRAPAAGVGVRWFHCGPFPLPCRRSS